MVHHGTSSSRPRSGRVRHASERTPRDDFVVLSATSPRRPKVTASSTLPVGPIKAALVVFLAGAGSIISQLSLSPVFGSIPASRHHIEGIICTGLAALLLDFRLRGSDLTRQREWLPFLAWSAIPIQHYVCRLSGWFGPVYGPLITELCTYYPTIWVSLLIARAETDSTWLVSHPAAAYLISAAWLCIIFGFGKTVADTLLPSLVGISSYFTRRGLQTAIAFGYTALGPASALLPSLVPVIWLLLFDPHMSLRTVTLPPNKSLSHYNYTLLERKESLTGYVSVLDSHNDEFRVLRCDHSLLGGDWLVTERSRRRGLRKRETVYSVFTMLEAVRLVERSTPVSDVDSSGLFIGLGIGTSPKAFIEHGINTTIVELDPVVHEFATKYFELPAGHQAYLQDAVPFVEKFSVSEPASYDFIVHDVFTGGAEPTALFTLEFLEGLARLLKDDGVIAINYAADLSLPVPKIIIRTILEVFPTCRLFRDALPEQTGSESSFVNMVLFCAKSPNGQIVFREAVPADWLESLSRRQWIPPSDNLEMPLSDFLGAQELKTSEMVLRKGQEAKIERFHHISAERHWRIMRTVLPHAVWELW